MPSALAAPRARMPAARVAFADQPRMLECFGLFGRLPVDGYTAVVADDPLEIPLESQTLSTFGTNHLGRSWEAQRLIAHELAHQWFGNSRHRRLAGGTSGSTRASPATPSGCGRTIRAHHRPGGGAGHHVVLGRLPHDLVLTDPGPTAFSTTGSTNAAP